MISNQFMHIIGFILLAGIVLLLMILSVKETVGNK